MFRLENSTIQPLNYSVKVLKVRDAQLHNVEF